MRMKKRVRSKPSAGLKHLARYAKKWKVRPIGVRTMAGAAIGALVAVVLIVMAASSFTSKRSALHASALAPAAASTPSEPSGEPIPVAPPIVPAADTVATTGVKAAPVTITGCLERNADTFRLKDTAGDNAPRSRSWKSGFMKKGPAPVDVVDASNRAKLASHVGQRVSVTGTLVDREMQVRSLQRVATSCSAKS